MEINIEDWHEFEVGKLFKIFKSKTYNKGDVTSDFSEDDETINYVTRSKFNNGVTDIVKKENDFEVNPKGTISFGAENADFFIQTEEYITGNSMCYIDTKHLTMNQALFIKTILQKQITQRYGFTDGLTGSKLKKEKILLPAIYNAEKDDYDPDWNYMEEFIRELKEENERKLFSLKTLFNPDNALIRDGGGYELDISSWHEFEVEELFNILALKEKLGVEDVDIAGDTPVYSSETQNYGLYGYTSKKAQYAINDDNPFYIIFGDHTRAFNFVFSDFSISDNVKVLSPKFGNNINTALFIITSWSKAIPDLGYSRHWSIAKNIKILLPAIYNSEKEEYKPDWEYMENFITNLQKETKNQLRRLKQKNE